MLHLHHLANSRSFRIIWLLEELEVDYKLTCYARNKAYRAPDSLKQIHPLGHAPMLEVNERVLIESGFIIEYLLKHYDTEKQFKPADDNEAAWEAYTFWLHFAEASVMPPLVMRLVFTKVVEQSPMLIKPVSKSIRNQVEKSIGTDNSKMHLDISGTKFSPCKPMIVLQMLLHHRQYSIQTFAYHIFFDLVADAFAHRLDEHGRLLNHFGKYQTHDQWRHH